MGGCTESYASMVRAIKAADRRIDTVIRRTPLENSPWLSGLGQARVWLKCENMQITGSFKLRGAANLILSLSPEERKRDLLTASTGNHGQAMAFMMQREKAKGAVFVPQNISESKLDLLRRYSIPIVQHGSECSDAERFAKREAEKHGHQYISPYNDERIIAGHGTLGPELLRQNEDLDTVLVPVGGGGLTSGLALFLKSVRPSVEIIGCQPIRSAVMARSIEAGRIVVEKAKPTLSDGTAGGIEEGAVTFDICRRWVSRFILLEEFEIKTAIRGMIDMHHMLVEGSGALPVAAFIKEKEKFNGRNVALIVTGSNIGTRTLKRIL